MGLSSTVMEQTLDYDSGARDLSPEPINIQKLMEAHDPVTLQKLKDIADRLGQEQGPYMMDLINTVSYTTSLTTVSALISYPGPLHDRPHQHSELHNLSHYCICSYKLPRAPT